MTKTRIEYIKEQIADKKERLALYRQMERNILEGLPQSYGIGTRSVSRYSMSLDDLMNAIATLEKELDNLENMLAGSNRRRAVGVVPRDW